MKTNPFQAIYDICNSQTAEEKMASLPDWPRYLDVELTNHCNFRCLFCVTGTRQHKREKGYISDDTFYSVLDQCAEHEIPIRFVRWGEPFMHPRIFEYLEACKERGVLTHITTNGSLLTKAKLKQLIDIPLDSIKFSFQGTDRDSFLDMRNTDFFDNLMDVIEQLHTLRADKEAPFIHASTSVTDETQAQIQAFKARIGKITDSHNLGRTILDRVDPEKGTLNDDERDRLRTIKEKDVADKIHFQCHQVYDVLSINWDGSASACCGDYDNYMLVGDTQKQTLHEIWHSKKFTTYRKMLAQMRHNELPLCRICFDMNQKRPIIL